MFPKKKAKRTEAETRAALVVNAFNGITNVYPNISDKELLKQINDYSGVSAAEAKKILKERFIIKDRFN